MSLHKIIIDMLILYSGPDESPLNKEYTKIIRLNYLLNFFKLNSFFFMLILMFYKNNFNLECWVYLSMHGSYGFIWIIKDLLFPDKIFQKRIGLPFVIVLSIILSTYYLPAITLIYKLTESISYFRITISFMLYSLGLILVIGTDIQKYVHLSFKKELIKDGFLRYNRNTNYLGEMIVYLSFCTLAHNVYSYLIIMGVLSCLFVVFICKKEISLSKKEGYTEYANSSNIILFKVSSNDVINYLLYFLIMVLLIYVIAFAK